MSLFRGSIAASVNIVECEDGRKAQVVLANAGSVRKNPKNPVFTALSGGILAWPRGERYLKRKYGADFKDAPREDGGVDLRCILREEREEEFIEEMTNLLAARYESPRACIEREMRGELGKVEIPELQTFPILPKPSLFRKIRFKERGYYHQPRPDDGVGTSANAGAIRSRRMFYMFDMIVPVIVWEYMEKSPILKFLTKGEAALTNGGRRKAELDGFTIGDNVFILPEDTKTKK